MSCNIIMSSAWVSIEEFEIAFNQAFSLSTDFSSLSIYFPNRCSIMIDGALRVLSLVSYSLHSQKSVILHFDSIDDKAMSYLNRIGFFDMLPEQEYLKIIPSRPVHSSADIYRGNNPGTIEIGHVNIGARDQDLPKRLAKAIAVNAKLSQEIEDDIWLILAELIDNISRHSESQTGGYVALQAYLKGNKIKVVVSDNGLGLFTTLRPSLGTALAKLSDTVLLLEIFRKGGISRQGFGYGNGLHSSASKAIKYNATLDIRLATSRMELSPSKQGYTIAKCHENLPLMSGTHFSFTFPLDKTL